MKKPGQVAVFRFPQTDLNEGKLRPALLIAPLPGHHKDWLCCMISTQMHQAITDFDETIDQDSLDFIPSGLKVPSLVRVGRLAVINSDILIGTLGDISHERLHRIQNSLASWIQGKFN